MNHQHHHRQKNQILAELSRSYKSRHFFDLSSSSSPLAGAGAIGSATVASSQTNDRKRQKLENPSQSSTVSSCFEVRRCEEKGGIAIFATKPIECGDLIISNEDPIISSCSGIISSSEHNNNFQRNSKICANCSTPIGSMREQLGAPTGLILPYLEEDSNGVTFTKEEDVVSCQECQMALWCSRNCHESHHVQHSFTCARVKVDGGANSITQQYQNRYKALIEFYESLNKTSTSPLIFQLAHNAITLIISKIVSPKRKATPKEQTAQNEKALFWWRDYGSHPLWWEILSIHRNSEQQQQRKCLAEEFADILRDLMHTLICSNLAYEVEDCPKPSLLACVDRLCSLEPIGEILGMLQCNVMEFEYASPVQQYMEFLHLDDNDDDEDEDFGENDSGGYLDIEETETCRDRQQENRKDSSNEPDNESFVEDDQHKALAWLTKHVTNPQETDDDDDGQTMRVVAAPIVGSGLYPLLTLANHDCNPNASIEFLQESNRGSMLALRNIEVGEEITITYVPNGGGIMQDDDDDVNLSSKRFKYFEPTRTWKWLQVFDKDDEGSMNKDGDASEHIVTENREADVEVAEGGLNSTLLPEKGNPDGNDDNPLVEGAGYRERQSALLEYNFRCRCSRCLREMKTGSAEKRGDRR